MKIIKKHISVNDENGNSVTLVSVLLLCMTLIATASVTLARTQFIMARFSRQTSNSYYLARSGAEKVVDSINKEIAMELPNLMEKASKEALGTMLGSTTKDGEIQYITDGDVYSGEYKGYKKDIGRSEQDNKYEIKLKELMYKHIRDSVPLTDYKAYSDVKTGVPIEITTKIFDRDTPIGNVPEDLKALVGGLVPTLDVGTTDGDVFAVEVIARARAKKDAQTSYTKSRVVATISLDQVSLNNEQLLEEYEWAEVYPEALQGAITSFGDLVIQGDYSLTINEGDVLVKGTQRKATDAEYASGDFPEPDESGGITVSEGGKLTINGNALVVSNIQTTNTFGKESSGAKIDIKDDAIANTIAIHDSYYVGHLTNTEPWTKYATNNKISIGRNAFVDNDIRIDRYIENPDPMDNINNVDIDIKGSAFGISDKDTEGKLIGGTVVVDPNKSSGIFSQGKNSAVSVGRAFIAGQPFINFGDGNGYHKLYESAGEPFEDVYYLDKYREQYGDDETYITELKDLIDKGKVKITDKLGSTPYGYAPAGVSATILGNTEGESYNIKTGSTPMSNQTNAEGIFYRGTGFGDKWQEGLAKNSDWESPILGTDKNWGSVASNTVDYYMGNNPFNKVYTPIVAGDTPFDYSKLLGYKGLQGYMLAKRGGFYGQFEATTGTTGYKPKERSFNDLIDLSAFAERHRWSYNNPISVITSSSDVEVDISKFGSIPTAIVSTSKKTIKLTTSGDTTFNGIIITPGKVEITSAMTINGVIIAGNECTETTPSRENIQNGTYAGVQISAKGVTVNYDKDMLLQIRFMDKSLQRRLYDALRITNYKEANKAANEQDRMDIIMGPKGKRKIKLSPLSVIDSKQGGLQFVMKSLRKL